MARRAWGCVTQETVANCWRHAGILPGSETTHQLNNSPQYTDKTTMTELQESLTELALTSIAKSDVPSLDELIDIPGEEVIEQELTDREIVEQVQEVHGLQQETLDIEEDELEETDLPPLTTTEALAMIGRLDIYFQRQTPTEFVKASSALQQVRRLLRLQQHSSLCQSSLHQFFSGNDVGGGAFLV